MGKKVMSYEEWCEKITTFDSYGSVLFLHCKAEDAYYVLKYMKEVYCADEVDYGNIYEEYYRYQKGNEDDREISGTDYVWKQCEKGRGAVKSFVYYIRRKRD